MNKPSVMISLKLVRWQDTMQHRSGTRRCSLSCIFTF